MDWSESGSPLSEKVDFGRKIRVGGCDADDRDVMKVVFQG